MEYRQRPENCQAFIVASQYAEGHFTQKHPTCLYKGLFLLRWIKILLVHELQLQLIAFLRGLDLCELCRKCFVGFFLCFVLTRRGF